MEQELDFSYEVVSAETLNSAQMDLEKQSQSLNQPPRATCVIGGFDGLVIVHKNSKMKSNKPARKEIGKQRCVKTNSIPTIIPYIICLWDSREEESPQREHTSPPKNAYSSKTWSTILMSTYLQLFAPLPFPKQQR